jgi:predicted  nucleic acid-binding Zn-ribbon protein
MRLVDGAIHMVDLLRYGRKFNCFQCETRFYDMNRPEPVCPKCGSNQRNAPKEEPGAIGDLEPAATDDELHEDEMLDDDEAATDLDDEDSPESLEESFDEDDADDDE